MAISEHHRAVPVEAVAFLAAVLVFVFLLILFFLYLNKSLCFAECGGFPCIDKIPQKDTTLDSEYDVETFSNIYHIPRIPAEQTICIDTANVSAHATPAAVTGRHQRKLYDIAEKKDNEGFVYANSSHEDSTGSRGKIPMGYFWKESQF